MATEHEFDEFTEGELPEDINCQDLLVDETHPEFHQGNRKRFDASLEEVLHLVQHVGWANAYPEIFGVEPDSRLAEAMDVARGGHFEDIPNQYPASAWYRYTDESCDYGCQVMEYSYWVTTSILGAHDYPGRAQEIAAEWQATTRALVQQRDPKAYRLFTSSEFKLPRVLPDGHYTGPALK